jgi:hypothetical protein
MSEHERMLRRQAEWQHERAKMSWPKKIRQVERLRAPIEAYRRLRPRPSAVGQTAQVKTTAPETRRDTLHESGRKPEGADGGDGE